MSTSLSEEEREFFMRRQIEIATIGLVLEPMGAPAETMAWLLWMVNRIEAILAGDEEELAVWRKLRQAH